MNKNKIFASFRTSHTRYSNFNKKTMLTTSKQSFSANKLFNEGILPFCVSSLVEKFEKNKCSKNIKELLEWKFIDKDKDLLQKLFDYKCFEEITLLIYKYKKKFKWSLTREMFKTIILKEELDLLIFFIKIKDCRIILEDQSIQKLIIDKYIK